MLSPNLLRRVKESAYLTGSFVTRSGTTTDYYIDKYLFGTQPDILKLIVSALKPVLPPLDQFKCLAAPELGAVSIVTALSIAIDKPFVIVRKLAKGYGTDQLIEGAYQPGDNMVLIEDVITTGGAALNAISVLKSAGVSVSHMIGIIDRESGGLANIAESGVHAQGLITTTMLRQVND
jgi:orotate phosphoribosyltransferase